MQKQECAIRYLDSRKMREDAFDGLRPYQEFISPERKNRIERLASKTAKMQSLLTELFMRREIAKRLHCLPQEVEFAYNEYGKPSVKGESEFHFSVSHSRGMLVYADAPAAVGVDVEQIRTPDLRVARRVFAQGERSQIEKEPFAPEQFYKIWTRKEAYLKMIGTGFAKSWEKTDVTAAQMDGLFFSAVQSGYMISACCAKGWTNQDVLLERIDVDELLGWYAAFR